MFCPRCGTKNPEGSANCFKCGQNMSKAPGPSLASSRPSAVPSPPPERKELGRVNIDDSLFLVTERDISFQESRLLSEAVTGIRFGVYKHYINGIRTSQSYSVWLTDGSSQIQIECAKGFLVSQSKIEQRYQDALKAVWPAVMVPLVNQFLEALASGQGFVVGDIKFDKAGLHRAGSMGTIAKGAASLWSSVAGGKSVEEREQDYKFLPWASYGGHSSTSGNIHLFRDKKSWASFSLRDTWNAVCLDPMFSFLYEDGKMWNFVNR